MRAHCGCLLWILIQHGCNIPVWAVFSDLKCVQSYICSPAYKQRAIDITEATMEAVRVSVVKSRDFIVSSDLTFGDR